MSAPQQGIQLSSPNCKSAYASMAAIIMMFGEHRGNDGAFPAYVANLHDLTRCPIGDKRYELTVSHGSRGSGLVDLTSRTCEYLARSSFDLTTSTIRHWQPLLTNATAHRQ
jgi:hypothetical protein